MFSKDILKSLVGNQKSYFNACTLENTCNVESRVKFDKIKYIFKVRILKNIYFKLGL